MLQSRTGTSSVHGGDASDPEPVRRMGKGQHASPARSFIKVVAAEKCDHDDRGIPESESSSGSDQGETEGGRPALDRPSRERRSSRSASHRGYSSSGSQRSRSALSWRTRSTASTALATSSACGPWPFASTHPLTLSGSRTGNCPAQHARSSAAATASHDRFRSGSSAALRTSSIAVAMTAPGSTASSTWRNHSAAASFSKLPTPHEPTNHTLHRLGQWPPRAARRARLRNAHCDEPFHARKHSRGGPRPHGYVHTQTLLRGPRDGRLRYGATR
jgi:hypothetical protein